MPAPPARPWQRKEQKPDRLQQMEEWAQRHPREMDPERTAKLAALREEYGAAYWHLRWYMTLAPRLLVDEMHHWAEESGYPLDAVESAARKLQSEKLIAYDYACTPVEKRWFHWYEATSLLREGTNEKRRRRNGADDAAGDGGNKRPVRRRAGDGESVLDALLSL